jgi:hypothetical protein
MLAAALSGPFHGICYSVCFMCWALVSYKLYRCCLHCMPCCAFLAATCTSCHRCAAACLSCCMFFLSCIFLGHANSEISEVIAASSPKSAAAASPRSPQLAALRASTAAAAAAPDSPKYVCTATGSDSGYCIVRNEDAAAAAQKADRWCMHGMADAVPYVRPPPTFPFQSVPVGPSAPMG